MADHVIFEKQGRLLLEEINGIDADLQTISLDIKSLKENYEEEVKSIKERFELFDTSLSLINKMIERKQNG